MAKPRIFVSSTYYDLKHVRKHLENFIESLGYDAVLFESGDIPFRHDQPIDESCYNEISTCHMLVLILGGRYGSQVSDEGKLSDKEIEKAYEQYNSITKKEYMTARDRDIPIFIFVDKNVLAEFNTYKANRENKTVKWAHVDSVNIFLLLEDILTQKRNNFVRGFENFDDISVWLKDQWAGLFAEFLSKKSQETTLSNLSSQISELSSVNKALREYSETILRSVAPETSTKIISEQQRQLVLSKMKRFYHEPMIRFLLDKGETTISRTEIFNAFFASKTLEDFLADCKFSPAFIVDFLDHHESNARRDFTEMRERYGNNIDDALNLETESLAVIDKILNPRVPKGKRPKA